jgi:hypothetical protein
LPPKPGLSYAQRYIYAGALASAERIGLVQQLSRWHRRHRLPDRTGRVGSLRFRMGLVCEHGRSQPRKGSALARLRCVEAGDHDFRCRNSRGKRSPRRNPEVLGGHAGGGQARVMGSVGPTRARQASTSPSVSDASGAGST